MMPRALEEEIAAGNVGMSELVEAYLLELADPWRGPEIYRWMHAERVAARESKLRRIQDLFTAAQAAAAGSEGQKELLAKIEELQGELKRGE